MIKIDFPQPAFKIKNENGKDLLFDSLRKKWVRLTPEEWVRQNFIQYLIQVKKYNPALIGVEKEISLGELKKRFDLLVFNANHHPWMLIECKAMDVELTENVLSQVLRYNISVPVNYIVITNGNYTYVWQKKEKEMIAVDHFPDCL